MFVGSTLINTADRNSVKSILTGTTGTCCGLLATIGFIITCFFLFLSPIIFYFRGDFVQGIFNRFIFQQQELSSGCNFKISLWFYNIKTHQLADHTFLWNYFNTRVAYASAAGNNFLAQVNPCKDEYFQQWLKKPSTIQTKDCYIAPDGLIYKSQLFNGALSVFGFKMQPICKDPFTCSVRSNVSQLANTYRLNFFAQHYYVLRFTSESLNQQGKLVKKFYQIYSTEWESRQTIQPRSYAELHTVKSYLDDSVMPWFNNKTQLHTQWFGLTRSTVINNATLLATGISSYIFISSNQKVVTRYYKKLDWLFGLIGGGILLLFIIFWVPCNFISTVKQKCMISQSSVLIRHTSQDFKNLNDTYKPSFMNPLWHLSTIFRLKLKKFKMQNKSIYQSQKLLDIVDLVKKLKIAKRNLQISDDQPQFEPRQVQFITEPSREYSQQQKKLEIRAQLLQQIRNDPSIIQNCSNNLPMLALINEGQQDRSEDIKRKMNDVMQTEKYSKYDVPKFASNKRSCPKCFSCLGKWIQKIITLVDVFGAKPNLTGNPHSSSICSCILTLIIILLSILTFALTLKNMSVTRVYWDKHFQQPQNQHFRIVTGKTFRAMICYPEAAFTNNLIVGDNKFANLMFYHYTRQGSNVEVKYFQTLKARSESDNYFDQPQQFSSLYSNNETNCLKPPNGIQVDIYGDSQSERESYVGFKATPYCSKTPTECSNISSTTLTNFMGFMNNYSTTLYFPQSHYNMEQAAMKVYSIGYSKARVFKANSTKSTIESIYLDRVDVIDDWAKWIMAPYSQPRETYISSDFQEIIPYQFQSVSDGQPYYQINIKTSGQISRVILTSYKIDFLFATIGGCFAFYYLIIGWVGKKYNNYHLKSQLADELYYQQSVKSSKCKRLLQFFGLCCKDPVLTKIQSDIDCLRLAQTVDNVYRLSVAKFEGKIAKDLALVYEKQRIGTYQKIASTKIFQRANRQPEQDIQRNQPLLAPERTNQNPNAVENIQNFEGSINDENTSNVIKQKQLEQQNPKLSIFCQPTTRQMQKCALPINKLDMFKNTAQLTIDGKRSVKSVCGGVCCIILTIFICLLLYHFLAIYFNQQFLVSTENLIPENYMDNKMSFVVGQNIKIAVSFYQDTDYSIANVSNLTKNVGMGLFLYRVQKKQIGYQTTQNIVDLVPCNDDYFQGFLSVRNYKEYYNNFSFAYCVPDGTKMNLYGKTQDQVRQYFSLRIYNHSDPNSTSFNATKTLLSTYLIKFHVSTPVIDFRPQSSQTYRIIDIIKSTVYQTSTSRSYNTTIRKTDMIFDTAIYTNNEYPSYSSYEVKSYFNSNQFYSSPSDPNNRYAQLNFVAENQYNRYTIKGIKPNEIFGMVGGCIALLFFGIGCIPRSFNQYKMRYLIGSKLFIIIAKKKKNSKYNFGKKKQNKSSQKSLVHLSQFSQFELMLAWFCSHISFAIQNFNFIDMVRYIALLQNRVSKETNIFQFMKNVFKCENAIKQLYPNSPNITKVFPKHIISLEEQGNQGQQLFSEIKDMHPILLQTSKIFKYTQWQLNAIIAAKSNNVDFSKVFKQQWLDQYAGIRRQKKKSKRQGARSDSSSTFFQGSQNSSSQIEQLRSQQRSELLNSTNKLHLIQQESIEQASQPDDKRRGKKKIQQQQDSSKVKIDQMQVANQHEQQIKDSKDIEQL